MTRYQIDARRLQKAWMDLLPALDVTQPQVQQMVPDRRRQREVQQGQMAQADDEYVIVTWNGQMEQAVYDEAIWLHRRTQQYTAHGISKGNVLCK